MYYLFDMKIGRTQWKHLQFNGKKTTNLQVIKHADILLVNDHSKL